MSTHLSSFFTIRMKDYKLRFYPTTLSLCLWLDPDDRSNDEIFFRKYLKENDNIVDVGANIGELTLTASSLINRDKNVFSIEAHPRVFNYLSGNVKYNKKKNIFLYNVALGETDGNILFSDISSDDQNQVVANGSGISIPMTRLDKLNIGADSISLMKIDVEGFELFVLRGGEQLLKKTSCIYFESWEKHFQNYSYSTKDILNLLIDSGFKTYRFSDISCLTEVNKEYISEHCENMLAIRDTNDFVSRTGFRIINA